MPELLILSYCMRHETDGSDGNQRPLRLHPAHRPRFPFTSMTMTSSDPLLSFRFTLFDFFFSSVTAIVEKARLRPFFGGDMRGAGLLRVSGMLVMQERDSRTMQSN